MTRLIMLAFVLFATNSIADDGVIALTGAIPQKIDEITAWLLAPPAMIQAIAGIVLGAAVELIAKRWPTANPHGWAHWLAGSLNLGSGVLAKLAKLASAGAQFSDKVLKQNLKPKLPEVKKEE